MLKLNTKQLTKKLKNTIIKNVNKINGPLAQLARAADS
jgi:hypothetical protein